MSAASRPGAPSRATMSEIAAAAGVSVPTVSKVVNGRSDVSPATRERVEELLRRHSYRPRRAKPEGDAVAAEEPAVRPEPGPIRSDRTPGAEVVMK